MKWYDILAKLYETTSIKINVLPIEAMLRHQTFPLWNWCNKVSDSCNNRLMDAVNNRITWVKHIRYFCHKRKKMFSFLLLYLCKTFVKTHSNKKNSFWAFASNFLAGSYPEIRQKNIHLTISSQAYKKIFLHAAYSSMLLHKYDETCVHFLS